MTVGNHFSRTFQPVHVGCPQRYYQICRRTEFAGRGEQPAVYILQTLLFRSGRETTVMREAMVHAPLLQQILGGEPFRVQQHAQSRSNRCGIIQRAERIYIYIEFIPGKPCPYILGETGA